MSGDSTSGVSRLRFPLFIVKTNKSWQQPLVNRLVIVLKLTIQLIFHTQFNSISVWKKHVFASTYTYKLWSSVLGCSLQMEVLSSCNLFVVPRSLCSNRYQNTMCVVSAQVVAKLSCIVTTRRQSEHLSAHHKLSVCLLYSLCVVAFLICVFMSGTDVSVCLVNTRIIVSSTSNVYVVFISILDITLNKCVLCACLCLEYVTNPWPLSWRNSVLHLSGQSLPLPTIILTFKTCLVRSTSN